MRFRFFSIILATLLMGGCAGGTHSTEKASYKQISMSEAMQIIESEKDYIILDVRRADEFSKGHIPGAINVPNESIGSGEIPELPNKDQMILVYCRSGRRSKEAASKLADLGYTDIIEFGGILDYKGELEK
ncbi:MAG: rhodanese-like domain-containing protein [Oscillospiraceae bacterium]|nr:rhodanese-like domain-containing protein [Oscillospiraceae bacterium]